MATTEGKHAGEFIVTDEGEDSRDAITVLTGQVLEAGDVIGRVTRKIGGLAIPTVVGTGDGTMTALSAGPDVEEGDYVITCITEAANGGVFSVVAPSGLALPNATVGTPYVSSHLNFTLNDGSTDYAEDDAFTVSIAAGTSATVVGTGNGTVTGISLGPDAKTGSYVVTITGAVTNGGVVEVLGPDGVEVASSITAGAGGTLVVAGREIRLTVTDGSTDFAKGDLARIVVFSPLVKKAVEWDPRPSAWDGRHEVYGIAWDNYDATSADVDGVAEVRRAVVNGAELGFKSTVSAAEEASAKAALTALGVVVR